MSFQTYYIRPMNDASNLVSLLHFRLDSITDFLYRSREIAAHFGSFVGKKPLNIVSECFEIVQ